MLDPAQVLLRVKIPKAFFNLTLEQKFGWSLWGLYLLLKLASEMAQYCGNLEFKIILMLQCLQEEKTVL